MCKTIEDLPEEVLEFILGFLPPYKDLENCLVVCKRWSGCVKKVMRKSRVNLQRAIAEYDIVWQTLTPIEMAPTISKRYSHSACIHDNSMYVFGGCTCTSTTFNDLWRLDLSKRQWVRPLTMGTYPSPKACASIVCFRDALILFGGWTHPSPYPLHQSWKLFNELHVYSITSNRWTSLNPTNSPPPMAGHSASIHGNIMVVFGGLQKYYSDYNSQFGSSNDVWCFNMDTQSWHTQATNTIKPASRYGQSQIVIDESHIMILGGCGGPNMIYSDCWLLTITEIGVWVWREIPIRNKESAPTHMWCNQACRVGNQVVILSQNKCSTNTPSYSANWNVPNRVRPNSSNAQRGAQQRMQGHGGPQDPPGVIINDAGPQRLNRHSPPSRVVDRDNNVNGKWGSLRNRRQRPGLQNDEPVAGPSGICNTNRQEEPLNQPGTSRQSQESLNLQPGPATKKLIRAKISYPPIDKSEPKRFNEYDADDQPLDMFAFNNPLNFMESTSQSERVRRLNALTQKLRQFEESFQRQQRQKEQEDEKYEEKDPSPSPKKQRRNQLGMYVLDISQILEVNCYVTWIPSNSIDLSEAPEETILYSLVAGKGELIMFGGIKKDVASCANCYSNVTEQVSHSLHFITAPKEII